MAEERTIRRMRRIVYRVNLLPRSAPKKNTARDLHPSKPTTGLLGTPDLGHPRLFLLQLGQRRQDLRTVLGGLHVLEDAGDLALRGDEEGVACGMREADHAQRPVLLGDRIIGVGQQPEAQALLDAKLTVRIRTV